MMHEHLLGGCIPTPLASYLKALGILRLVAEQKDPDVAGRWQGEQFVLRTVLSREELERFFLEEYRPTPILSPWNGRAGYLEGEDADTSNRGGAVLLREFRESSAVRFQSYRGLIQELDKTDSIEEMNAVRASKKELTKKKELVKKNKQNSRVWADEHQKLLSQMTIYEFRLTFLLLLKNILDQKLDQKLLAEMTEREAFLKENLFAYLRNNLDEDQLAWLDGTVALGEDKAFSPLLGSSGGVEGSMDLGVNFMENIKSLFHLGTGDTTSFSAAWLKTCLHQDLSMNKANNTAGSLSPGNIGGPNATTGFTAKTGINPWDYILMIEGALVLRPSLTRKLESSENSSLSYPFTIEPSASGGSNVSLVDEKKTRAGRSELWMPIWHVFAGFQEIAVCFREGSVTLNRRKARTGLDFARAISQLGADRGINQFQRFIFLKRSGDNDVAVPVGRFNVIRNPQVDLLSQLDRNAWLDRLRRFARDPQKAPGRIQQLVRRLEDEIFSLTQGGGRLALQNILTLLGKIQLVSAESARTREAVAPVPQLGTEWALEADDRSNEFRLASALAGLTLMRNYIVPLKADEKMKRSEWSPGNVLAVWGGGDLMTNLLRILDRCLLEAQRNQRADNPLAGNPTTDLAAVMAFLKEETDDRRIAGLLAGLINVDLPRCLPFREVEVEQPPAVFCLLKPLFTPESVLQQLDLLPQDAHLPLPREIVTLLRTGNRAQAGRAIDIARRRLRIAGLKLSAYPRSAPDIVGIDSPRLAAALMIPLAKGELSRICKPFTPAQEAN
ncbi:MAG: type I-U CRISPR-associated protein Csx17 [Deltaproteobacteria bacterium RIFOXYD12_FULL_50_9]|nr:MAG: type I-U CRISPR-associated protein Csx17 [Deltaproteobacteria bacterium RIFOXYD12_FULL_50_9]